MHRNQATSPFFFSETQTSHERLIYIDQGKTWHEAQDYCREHYTDLASGVAQINSQELQNRPNNSGKSWIGLFRDTWRLSDGSSASYRNWEPEFYEEHFFLYEKCAMMNTSGKWFYDDCHMQQTFFCYRGKFFDFLSFIPPRLLSPTLGEVIYDCL